MIKESLKNLSIDKLNEMQKKAIDAIYTHRNIFLHSPTGSGKTLAYLLPVAKIMVPKKMMLQAVIIVPTRELALQIADVHKVMRTPVPLVCCYGGHSIAAEKQSLLKNPSILVGTPGRIAAHLRNQRIDVSGVTVLVLDEFDKCLEIGFTDDMSYIIGALTRLKKRICISATRLASLPKYLMMSDPVTVEFSQEVIQPRISLKSVDSPSPDKLETLLRLIKYIGNEPTLVFCNHRDAVERVAAYLQMQKVGVLMYHGGMEQRDREKTLLFLRNGSCHLLVTTDLASRGLDIPEIRYIVHYHLPSTGAAFVHRNGRTARMNATGTAFVIFSENDKLPSYLPEKPASETVTADLPLPDSTLWVTICINAGKRDRISKGDVVGYLLQKGRLAAEDLGLVSVNDREAFAAVKQSKVKRLMALVVNEPLKRKRVTVTIAETCAKG